MRAPRAQALNYVEQMRQRAGKAIDPHHDQRVPLADPLQAACELDAAAAAAGGALLEDLAAARRAQRIELRVGLLLLGRDPGVADQRHGPILARPEALVHYRKLLANGRL